MRAGGVCFVTSGVHSASTEWFLGPAKLLGHAKTSIPRLAAGYDLGYDTYVIERETWHLPWAALQGRRVIAWLDDAYHAMPWVAPNYKRWKLEHSSFLASLRRCDGLVAPNPYLVADYAEALGPGAKVHFIPNYHTFTDPPPERTTQPANRPLVGWAGTFNHCTSWRDTRLADYLKGAVDCIEIVGPRPVYEMVARAGVEALYLGVLPRAEYHARVAGWDAYLIPVAGVYDRRRSWIKALEAAWCGTPWLALGEAASAVYRDCVGGIIEADASRLPTALPRLIEKGHDPVTLEAMRDWANAQALAKHLDEWRAALAD